MLGCILLNAGLLIELLLPCRCCCCCCCIAVAEELLFRGFLLTALQERLGRIDAVAVCAALFALIHLDPQQFFLYCVLGAAAGAAVTRSGNLGPAVALHFGFNAAAVVAGLALHVR
jgi:membrane protease YdiL (CAAX protease family)